MDINFFRPFDFVSECMIDFGIFLNDFNEGIIMTDVLVLLFIGLIIIPEVLKATKEKYPKKIIYFFKEKNNAIINLTLFYLTVICFIAFEKHGINGLMPILSLGGFTLVANIVFI